MENSGKCVTNVSTDIDEPQSGGDSNVAFSVQIPLQLDASDKNAEFAVVDAEMMDNESVLISFEGDLPMQDSQESSQQLSDTGEVTPPHRDPNALQAVYDESNTFVEMQRKLGTDVTPEAVRQQMVKHGIHTVPENGSTDEDDGGVAEAVGDSGSIREVPDPDAVKPNISQDSDQGETFASDGGIPSGLTVEEVKEIVKTSHTLYDATRKLSVDQSEAREILKQFNLLDLVTGRLTTRGEKEVTDEEINQRIRASNIVSS